MEKASIRFPAGAHDARWLDPFVVLEESIEELIRVAAIRFDVDGERRTRTAGKTRRRRRLRRGDADGSPR